MIFLITIDLVSVRKFLLCKLFLAFILKEETTLYISDYYRVDNQSGSLISTTYQKQPKRGNVEDIQYNKNRNSNNSLSIPGFRAPARGSLN